MHRGSDMYSVCGSKMYMYFYEGDPLYGYVRLSTLQFGGRDLSGEELTAEMIRKQMTEHEWTRIYEMSQDKALYQNLISSLFPTIHGQ